MPVLLIFILINQPPPKGSRLTNPGSFSSLGFTSTTSTLNGTNNAWASTADSYNDLVTIAQRSNQWTHHDTEGLLGKERFANRGEFHVEYLPELIRQVVGNAHGSDISIELDVFVRGDEQRGG